MKPEIHVDEPDYKAPERQLDCDMWIPERPVETDGKLYVAWAELGQDHSYHCELSDLMTDLLHWTSEPEYYDIVAAALEFQAQRMRVHGARLRAASAA
jgi:hypothetical protein